MKSNMIAKGLLSAAVAGLVAGAIVPTTAFAGGKDKAKAKCGKDGCKSEECKKHKESACSGPGGCSGKGSCTGKAAPADAAAAPAAPTAAPAPTGK